MPFVTILYSPPIAIFIKKLFPTCLEQAVMKLLAATSVESLRQNGMNRFWVSSSKTVDTTSQLPTMALNLCHNYSNQHTKAVGYRDWCSVHCPMNPIFSPFARLEPFNSIPNDAKPDSSSLALFVDYMNPLLAPHPRFLSPAPQLKGESSFAPISNSVAMMENIRC